MSDSPVKGEMKENRQHLIGQGLDPREMQRRSAESKRRKREALATGPREAIALGLHDELAALREATRLAVQDAASADVKVRGAAWARLPRLLDQALGTVERRTEDTQAAEGTLPQDREARMRLMAELEQRMSED